MRHLEPLPAWAERQRSRRLVRHSDEKVMRWINHQQVARDAATAPQTVMEPLSNDNVVIFTTSRSAHAS